MNKNKLLENLNILGLTGMINHINELNKTIYTDNEYGLLNQLLETEIAFKNSKSINYRLKLSKFPMIKLLKDTEQAKLLANIDMVDILQKQTNIIIIGSAGTGKTHLSIALGYDLILKGYKVIYFKLHELANVLLKYKLYNTHVKFYNKLKNFDMVIIDEFAYIPIEPQASYLLYELFSKLNGNSSVLLNTHVKFEEWGNIFGIDKTTKVIIDRITHNCQIINTGNISFRHKHKLNN